MALGLLQFGFVVTYLSDPLVRGYTTAASVHVLISQLKNVFGVSVGEHSWPLSLFVVSEGLTDTLESPDVVKRHLQDTWSPPKRANSKVSICFLS